jgi:uncharacterized protein YceK
MKPGFAIALAAACVALSGCATIIDGSSQKIGITTGEVSGARCTLSNGEGQWSVITPGTVKVERSKHDMKVVCSKPGLADATATIPSDLNGWALVNFAILDLPGLGVDAATGAINDYNDTTHVRMTQGYGTGGYGMQPQQSYPSYPAYPAQTQAPASETPPPAYVPNSQYPAPAQSYDDQSQMYPDQSQSPPDQSQTYPDQSYPDQSQQSYPQPQQSYPDQPQSGGSEAGTLPPL